MYLFIKNDFLKHVGSVIMGFGMLFQGITIMKAAIAPLSQSDGFISFPPLLVTSVRAGTNAASRIPSIFFFSRVRASMLVFLLHFYINSRYPLFRSGLSYVERM